MAAMNETYKQIVFYTNSIWQRRFHALAVAWFMCLVGWALVAIMPTVYQSSARVFVDTSNVLKPLLEGLAVEVDIDAELVVIKQTLTSRSNLATVARMTDLDITAATPAQMDRLLGSLKGRTRIRSKGNKLITISFIDPDPVRARDVVEALLTTFVEINLGHSRESIDSARQFLDSQVRVYEEQLEKAEKRLAEFKRERLVKLPELGTAQARLEELRNQLIELEATMRKAMLDRDMLRKQLQTTSSLKSQSLENAKISELESALQEMLTHYTDRHPEVIALRRKLAALQASEVSEAHTLDDGSSPPIDIDAAQVLSTSGETSLEYESLKLKHAQIAADIGFYKSKSGRIRNRVEFLKEVVFQIPDIEAERTSLNRDYEVLRTKYADLLSRREQANISRERDIRAEKLRFRVVDPPQVPNSPSGPSRRLLLTVALLFGIGAGVAFALILGVLNDTFSAPAQLREAFALPVLGVVSTVDTFMQHTRRAARNSAFVALTLLLFAAYGGIVIVEQHIGLAMVVGDATNLYDSLLSTVDRLLP